MLAFAILSRRTSLMLVLLFIWASLPTRWFICIFLGCTSVPWKGTPTTSSSHLQFVFVTPVGLLCLFWFSVRLGVARAPSAPGCWASAPGFFSFPSSPSSQLIWHGTRVVLILPALLLPLKPLGLLFRLCSPEYRSLCHPQTVSFSQLGLVRLLRSL